jgi:hypothetical protein
LRRQRAPASIEMTCNCVSELDECPARSRHCVITLTADQRDCSLRSQLTRGRGWCWH